MSRKLKVDCVQVGGVIMSVTSILKFGSMISSAVRPGCQIRELIREAEMIL